jgi:predicted amidohydrolase
MPTPTPIRIATAQYPLDTLPTLGAYRDKAARWVAEAASNGAEILVFPEYGAMEYACAFGTDVAADLNASLEAVAGALPEMDAAHAELARRHKVTILAPSGPRRRAGGPVVNAARIFAPSGAQGTQVKQIMTPFEVRWGVTPGKTLRIFETPRAKIGIAICYDSEFPLLVRALAEAGAELILIPSCTEFVSGANRIRTAALARALENTCATITSPAVGDAPWSPAVDRNAGTAGLYVPAEHGLSDTGVLAEGTLNAPGWIYGAVDLAHLARLRTTGEMRNTTDWSHQPGATPLAAAVHHVDLR